MRHIAILRNDFETFDRLGVADYVIEVDRAVFLDPRFLSEGKVRLNSGHRIVPWKIIGCIVRLDAVAGGRG